MLTFIKEILTWWNRQTLGTRIQTILFGKFIGEDEFGNKYYENKKRKKRWIIYNGEIEATKIPVEWYSWIHFTTNKIENKHVVKKGDTLYSISKKFNISVSELVKINDIKNNTISIGQTLKIIK